MYKKERKDYMDAEHAPSRGGRPPIDEPQHDRYLDYKVLKDLPNSSYGVKVDPYTEANNPTTPYHLLNRFNKILGGRYKGIDNLGGGNLIQYNSAVSSKFLKVFDSALMALGLNYNYLPILASDTGRGGDMVDEMRKAISEVVSSLSATTFKDQQIYYYAVITDLPMGSATARYAQTDESGVVTITDTEPEEGEYEIVYTDIADVIYALCIEYQLIIQNYALVFNLFNSHRVKMGTMINMSWNREVAALNSYFGLLKKKSFLALFDSFALNLQGEYVDTEFMRQANMINTVAGRRSNDMNNPLLEITSFINMPTTFKTVICTTTGKTTGAIAFDFDNLVYQPSGADSPITFTDAIKTLALRCTANDTLYWARTLSGNEVNEADRFNELVRCLNVLTYCMNVFKPAFEDLRTVLNIMNRIGVVRWSLGTRFKIVADTDIEMTNYLVVKDIYSMVLGGASKVTFNNTTKRWRTFALWNIYYGTPEYANKSGGIFLTMSCKTLDDTGATSNIGYLPIGFTLGSFGSGDASGSAQYCRLISRAPTSNNAVYVTRSDVTMNTNKVFSRLVPLSSQSALTVSVPSASVSGLADASFVYRVLLQIAGLCAVTQSGTTEYGLEPDTLAIMEYEVEDFTNEVIGFCRGNGPFKVALATESTLGFYGLATSEK